MFAKSHVTMQNTEYRIFIVNRNPVTDHWYTGTTKSLPCMTGQLGQPTHPASWPSQLTKDCQPSECTEEHYVSLPGMEHMSVELRKYMVIHIYGITLNAAKSADQYYSSYSYQSLSLIIYLTYNDLHHDCKPYEQTREFFTVSLYSP